MSFSSSPPDPSHGPRVVATDLVVTYRDGARAVRGLRGLTATFAAGITGLVGPNGAGKSTLLRTLCGLLSPVSGSVTVAGLEPPAFVRTHGVGFLPEDPPLPPYLTVRELLGGIPGQRGASAGAEDSRPLLPGLADLMRRRIGTLSQGQRKKAALAAALVGDPTLILLDEPTNGLDPMAVRELREILKHMEREGRTVVVSSHHLDELQRIADTLVFVGEGRSLGCWTREGALEEFSSFDALFDHVFARGIP